MEHMNPFMANAQINNNWKGLSWEPPNYPFRWTWNNYTTYVTTYLDRNLTHDSDILNAFAGIINVAADSGLITLHGLLKQFFWS